MSKMEKEQEAKAMRGRIYEEDKEPKKQEELRRRHVYRHKFQISNSLLSSEGANVLGKEMKK